MVKGSCHCGAVQFELAETPKKLTDCNCSVCRRLGCLWAHLDASKVKLKRQANATFGYSWGDNNLAFHSCKTCGCTTHWEGLMPEKSTRMAVNCRMCDPADIETIPIRSFDGAVTWKYLD